MVNGQVQHRHLTGTEINGADPMSRAALRIVRRTEHHRIFVDRHCLPPLEAVIACGDDISPRRKDLFHRVLGDAVSLCGIFAVDNNHIDFVCAFDCRKMFL